MLPFYTVLSRGSYQKHPAKAFEMWLYRRIFKISWVEHITSKEVLRRMKKKQTFYTELKQRKFECIGHIMRISDRCRFLQLILQGKLQGKRSVGRRRISWLNRRIISSCSGQSPHHHHHSQYPQGIDT